MNTTSIVNTTASPIVPSRLAVPPPALALDLTDMDRRVGWVSGDTVGFRGFGSSVEAAHAAWLAHRTLARRLDRRASGGQPLPIDPEPLALARSGGRESILAGGRPIAALLRPDAESASGPDSFGFEIRLDSPTNELTMRAAAHLIYRTLRRSGVRWAMWAREPQRETTPSAQALPQHEPRAVAAAPGPMETHRREASFGATLIRLTAIVAMVMLVALAARGGSATEPITIPVTVVALAGLGAAMVSAASRRWTPRRLHATRRGHVAAGPNQTNTPSRRED